MLRFILKKRPPFLMFVRAQTSAFIGGMVDYAFMIVLTEFLHIHYTISIIISGLIGAVVNFSINRKWTFHAEDGRINAQVVRFAMVVLGSVLLKSSGTYFFTTWLVIDYKISRIMTDLIVSLGFNYTLQTLWVFRYRKLHNHR